MDGKIRGTEMIYQACCQFLDKQPVWSAHDVDFGDHQPYNFTESKQQDKRQAFLQAYDIMADDARLKLLLSNPDLDIDKYFDGLRKNYPVRREWGFC